MPAYSCVGGSATALQCRSFRIARTPRRLRLAPCTTNPRAVRAAPSGRVQAQASSDAKPRLSVLLECYGVVTDLHIDGHMEAFNRAFAELGYDCATWTRTIYHDLLLSGDGTGVGMIRSYFDRVGWPQFLPTVEREMFAGKVYDIKSRQLQKILEQGQLPLRPGAADFMRDVLADGACVGLMTETNSPPELRVVDAVMGALGPDLSNGIRVFSTADSAHESSSSEEQQGGAAEGMTMEQAMAQAQAKAKARDAAAFAAAAEGSAVIGVSPHLLAGRSGGPATLMSASFISVANLTMGTSASRCAVLAASSSVMEAAKGAGALCLAVPPSLSARGRFPAADATLDGYGQGGGASWPRIKAALLKRTATATEAAQ